MLFFGISLLTVFCLISVFALDVHTWFNGSAKILLVIACFIPIVNWGIAAFAIHQWLVKFKVL